MSKIFLYICLLFCTTSYAQSSVKKAKILVTTNKAKPQIGEIIDLVIEAHIYPQWKMFSSNKQVFPGPKATVIQLEKNDSFQLQGTLQSIAPIVKNDTFWKGEVSFFRHKARFIQKVKILKPQAQLKGIIIYQLCTIHDGTCIRYQDAFRVSLR